MFLHEFAYSVCSLDNRKTIQLRNLGVFVANNWQHVPHLLLDVQNVNNREDQVRVSLRSVEGCGSNGQKTP